MKSFTGVCNRTKPNWPISASAFRRRQQLFRALHQQEQGLGMDQGSFAGVLRRLGSVEDSLTKNTRQEFPLFRISGFADLDTGMFSQSTNSRAEYGNIQNGTDFRRARLNANGNLTEQTRYWLEVDFAAAGRPSFMDVWGEQGDIPFFGSIRLGQYRQPVTLDGAVNVRHLEFMEYSSSFSAFDPFRRVGVASWFLSENERTFINHSVYGTGATFYNGTNPNNGATVYNSLGVDNRYATTLGNHGVSFAARGTHLLYWDEASNGRYFWALVEHPCSLRPRLAGPLRRTLPPCPAARGTFLALGPQGLGAGCRTAGNAEGLLHRAPGQIRAGQSDGDRAADGIDP